MDAELVSDLSEYVQSLILRDRDRYFCKLTLAILTRF